MNTWEELLAVYDNLPAATPAPVFYRLYYNDHGHPIFYTMEDLPGNYIDVDRETYVVGSHNVRVINGRLVHLTLKTSEKLRPSDTGTACHPRYVSVVDPTSTTYWSKHFYGNDTD